MITVEKEVQVDRLAEEVFDFLADVRNEERWNPNVVRIESESDGPLSVGDSFEGVYRRGGRMRFELVEAVRPSRLVFQGGGRQMTLVATLELERGRLGDVRPDEGPDGASRPDEAARAAHAEADRASV